MGRGKSCGGNGVVILAILFIASPTHPHNYCALDNASRSLWRTQMCPDVVVVVKKDGEGKLEDPPSISLLCSKVGGDGCFALLY
eukprot:3352698-Ditylum_brightwellii.AAC.1